MGDMMRPLSFHRLMTQALNEYKTRQTIFNVKQIYRDPASANKLSLFGQQLENPLGAAAGPNTQLAQNLVACYAGGCRFFELKTVQTLDGTNLHIDKPCIRAEDECYNVEWSTELFVEEALTEYIKGWYALKLLSRELELGDPNGFMFNMSVGYDLPGIQSEKIDNFIEGMKNATGQQAWKDCEAWALANLGLFTHVDEAYVKQISGEICTAVTLSTMHGCPADQIEAIAAYLLEEKHLNTYIKCNPTLLGYDFVRDLLDKMGYDYLAFDDHNFVADLQYADAVPMLKRLKGRADTCGLDFGVKLSNTFPVSIHKGELPGDQMYMSGKALYPLTVNLAAKLSAEFEGKLNISFSGGADKNNIGELFSCGIWPTTVCTVLLRTPGLDAAKPLADALAKLPYPADQTVDVDRIKALAAAVGEDARYCKSAANRAKQDKIDGYETAHSDQVTCRVLCGSCVRVCPNRANEVVETEAGRLIVHLDTFCNECGNCKVFCVEPCYPYQDRITYFESEADFADSKNPGFLLLEGGRVRYRWDGQIAEGADAELPSILKGVVDAFVKQHPWHTA